MPRVLLIGFDPSAIPLQAPVAVEPAFEHARRRAAEEGVELVEFLIALDASAEASVIEAVRDGVWDCVVVGGGIRKPQPALEFFEHVVNVVHRYAPTAALAFNTSPADTIESSFRAIGYAKQL